MLPRLLWTTVFAFSTLSTELALNISSPRVHAQLSGSAIRDGQGPVSDLPIPFNPATGGLDFNPKIYANDELFKLHKDKGERLICLMQATDKGAGFLMMDKREPPSAASKWTGDLKSELATWYWHRMDVDIEWDCDWDRKGFKSAFDALGLNAKPAFDEEGDPIEGGHNDCVSLRHYDSNSMVPGDQWGQMKPVREQKYKVGEKEYTATGGYYEFALNKIDGAIIGTNLMNPKQAVLDGHGWGRPAAPDELPDLRVCSDIYLSHWVRDNPNIRNFRVYGAHTVINDNTVLLATRALKNRDKWKLREWPGESFTAETDEGKALIGSQIGATAAHFLISHKAELGIKHITKVSVFTNKKRRGGFGEDPVLEMHIFFEIEDVPADKIPKDDEDEEKPPPEEQKSGGGPSQAKALRSQKDSKNILRVHRL